MGCGVSTAEAAAAPSAPNNGKTSATRGWKEGSDVQVLSLVNSKLTEEELLGTFEKPPPAGFLFKTLPQETKSLRVDLSLSPNLGDEVILQMAESLPPALVSLEINLNCTGAGKLITDKGMIQVIDAMHQSKASIEKLCLELYGTCVGDKSLTVLADLTSAGCDSLKEILLGCGECPNMSDEGVAVLASSFPPNLTKLTVDFDTCPGITVAAMSTIVENLPASVSELALHFGGDEGVTQEKCEEIANNIPATVAKLDLCSMVVKGDWTQQEIETSKMRRASRSGEN